MNLRQTTQGGSLKCIIFTIIAANLISCDKVINLVPVIPESQGNLQYSIAGIKWKRLCIKSEDFQIEIETILTNDKDLIFGLDIAAYAELTVIPDKFAAEINETEIKGELNEFIDYRKSKAATEFVIPKDAHKKMCYCVHLTDELRDSIKMACVLLNGIIPNSLKHLDEICFATDTTINR
jgi:hypothetical protein